MNYWCQVLEWYQVGGHTQILGESLRSLEQACGSRKEQCVDLGEAEAAGPPNELDRGEGKDSRATWRTQQTQALS